MFTQLLERLATVLDLAQIPYMIIGGQAVLLYGEPRLTGDIDITIAHTPVRFHRGVYRPNQSRKALSSAA